MEASIILLSSMSPKVRRHKKPSRPPATKLALKKSVRRSSIYDKKAETSDLIVVENSTESSSSSEVGRKVVNTSPIVISDSDSSGSEEAAAVVKGRCSDQKVAQIEDWIRNVNIQNERDRDVELSGFCEVSSILPKHTDKGSANSTFNVKGDHCQFDKVFRKKVSVNTDINSGKSSCKSIVDDSFEELQQDERNCERKEFQDNTPVSKPKRSDDSADDENVSHAVDVLDELYGNSWRAKENEVLTHSQPKNRVRAPMFLDDTEKERTPLVHRNPYLEAESTKSTNLLKSLQKARIEAVLMSPFMNNLKNLCDSDSDSAPEKHMGATRKKLDFEEASDKENFSDLDGDDLETRIRKKLNKNINKSAKPEFNTISDKEKFCDLGKGDVEARIQKKLTRKEKDKPWKGKTIEKNFSNRAEKKEIRTPSDKTEEEKGSSSSSDEDRLWWKPSRKSELKLYKERKTTKVFSFLASLSKTVPPQQSDPSALIYRNDFKKHRDALVQKLFKLYNETIFDGSVPEDTPFVWSTRMRGTAGYCYCRKATKNGEIVSRSVRIVLSTKVVDCAERVRDTLVHEMCHAATWMVNHVSDGHGPYWRAWADKAVRAYPELPPIRRCHDYDINTKYTYKCVNCGYSIGRHTKSLDIERKRCGYCYGKFEVLLNKQTKEGKMQSVPATPKKASAFALFVKDHYASTKTPNLNHGEVMKILGQKFSELKVTQTKVKD